MKKRWREVGWHNAHAVYSEGWKRATETEAALGGGKRGGGSGAYWVGAQRGPAYPYDISFIQSQDNCCTPRSISKRVLYTILVPKTFKIKIYSKFHIVGKHFTGKQIIANEKSFLSLGTCYYNTPRDKIWNVCMRQNNNVFSVINKSHTYLL